MANGPGKRAVVWVQGCSIHCPKCWNKETWDQDKGDDFEVDFAVKNLFDQGNADRVLDLTITQPFSKFKHFTTAGHESLLSFIG